MAALYPGAFDPDLQSALLRRRTEGAPRQSADDRTFSASVYVAWLSQGMADVPADEAWLSPREAAALARMRFPKRRSEFRLGRWTATSAIARGRGRPPAPEDLRAIEIDRAPDGAPAPLVDGRPAAVSISMTDRADQAVCVTGPPGIGLGCDLELVEPRSAAFVADYLTARERRMVEEAATDEERHLLANLVWCGKESALKILRTGLRRDTRSVEVSRPGPPADGWSPLLVGTAEGSEFPGWWRRYGPFLLTVAADVAIGPPRSLVEPPGLASASPAHAWMTRRG
jgi:4'-phosphopantetheinyl transferase